MAKEQLEQLRRSVEEWNRWRMENPGIHPDLAEVDLKRLNLIGANLKEVNFRAANFCEAYLCQADFRKADLEGANFRAAYLTEASLREANLRKADLKFASCGEADFQGADLREVDFREIDLSGANLMGACLIAANLSKAELRDANLRGADLREVNLSGADVLGTDFADALFTGACLKDWHTNHSTTLERAQADYIYLSRDKGQFSERRPHFSRFKPGEFATLFQQALHAVDLIFVDGIDWQAFFTSFQELRQQYNEADLTIQALEKTQSGSFIVRLEVPEEADKAAIERDAKAYYENQLQLVEAQYREQLQAQGYELASYQRENANLMQIMSWMSQRPINVNQTMNQSQGPQFTNNNQGATIGNFANQLNDNASQNTYSSEQRQTLAEAAQEIQALLDQLSQTHPTDTLTQKAQLVEEAIAQIQTNPPLKQRILSALDAGTMGAVAQALNHPAAAFFIEAVKDWNQNEPE